MYVKREKTVNKGKTIKLNLLMAKVLLMAAHSDSPPSLSLCPVALLLLFLNFNSTLLKSPLCSIENT